MRLQVKLSAPWTATGRLRRATALLLAAGAAFAAGSMGSALTTAAASDPGGIFPLPQQFPNFWWDHPGSQYPPPNTMDTDNTTAFTDPSQHLVFEFEGFVSCPNIPNLVALDQDTGAVKATVPLSDCPSPGNNGNSKSPLVAVDAADGVFFMGSQSDFARTVYVFNETTLHRTQLVSLPATVGGARLAGMSYSPANGEIVVTMDVGGAVVDPGVTVAAFKASDLARGTATALWMTSATGCESSLIPHFYSANPYFSGDGAAVYVPCQLTGSGAGLEGKAPERDGVVRLELNTKDASGQACGNGAPMCPDGNSAVAVAPGPAQDFIFDPGSDRGFMPAQTFGGTAPGISVLVYSGTKSVFLGRASVGGPSDANGISFGIDTGTGRLYAVGADGLTIIDGRRTPVAPGVRYPEFGGKTNYVTLPVIAPDAVYSHPRLLVGFTTATPFPGCAACAEHDLTVFVDALPVTVDPPDSVVDNNTFSGTIPPGATIAATYGGTARGYGIHSDMVSGPFGAITDSVGSIPVALPFQRAAPDLMAASVDQVVLQNGSAQASATALTDANGSTAYNTQQCSDLSSPQSCTPTLGQVPGSSSAGRATGPTGQQWPFPSATCSQPGSDTLRTGSSDGFYTTSYQSQPSAPPQAGQAVAPGSTTNGGAHARVDCAATQPSNGSAYGESRVGALHQPEGGATIDLGAATVTASVQPPTDASGVMTSVVSAARGIHIDLGGGNGIDIGEISQTASTHANGQKGGAAGKRDVVLGDVSYTLNGTRTFLCKGTCTTAVTTVAEQLNTAFPTVIHVVAPDAAPIMAGSPGGYEAAVQANSAEQFGDQGFNSMSAEEASLLPALRMVLYYVQDGQPNLSREVVDFAGVEADTQMGLQVFPADDGSIAPPVTVDQALDAAGVPASSQFIPGTPGTPSSGDNGGGAAAPAATGPLGVLEASLTGLGWLYRSPGAALQMFAFLLLLGAPLVLISRRRWLQGDATGEEA